jgi:hypothetical protein
MHRSETAAALRAPALGLTAAGFIFGREWFFYPALPLLALSLCDCRLAAAVAGVLRKTAAAIAGAVSSAALALVFYLAVTPSALLYRLFSRAPEHFRRDPGATLFEEAEPGAYAAENFEKPW